MHSLDLQWFGWFTQQDLSRMSHEAWAALRDALDGYDVFTSTAGPDLPLAGLQAQLRALLNGWQAGEPQPFPALAMGRDNGAVRLYGPAQEALRWRLLFLLAQEAERESQRPVMREELGA